MQWLFSILVAFYTLTTILLLHGDNQEAKCILITGGAGFIGSHINKSLHQAGYQTVVLDNLCRGSATAVTDGIFIQGDLSDAPLLKEIFSSRRIDAVIHCAALTDVGESCRDSLKYYQNNVAATINLLDVMVRHGTSVFVFASSAAVYGASQDSLVTEDCPCHPINPYGHTKLMIEQVLPSLDTAYGLKYCCFRFFNVAGGDKDGKLKNYKPHESNLIQIVLRSLLNPDGVVTIFGTDYPTPDGTGVRDYIHVEDLTTAIMAAMEKLFEGGASACYNLGNGKGYSVQEVIEAAEKVTGRKVNVIKGPRREGDPAILLACSDKARKELGWKPLFESIEDMITHAWLALQP